MDALNLSGELHVVMEALTDALNQLRRQLADCEIDHCRAFELPPVTPEEELVEPTEIIPTPLDGDAAVDAVLAAFTRFHTGGDLSTRVVFRLPGAIAVSTPDPQALVDQVQAVNELKQRFDTLAQSVRDPDERWDLIHRNFPGVVYLQVVRELKVVATPLQSVTFSWGRKPSSQLITPESADAKLEWAAKNPTPPLLARTGLSISQLQHTVARERSFLATLAPDTRIRYRRELRVRPLANLLFEEGAEVARRKAQRDAHTPLIVINSPAVKLGNLKPYDAGKRSARKSRDDSRAKGRPISRVLPLFFE